MPNSQLRQHYDTGVLVGPQIDEVSAYLRQSKRRRPPYVTGNLKEPPSRSGHIFPGVLMKGMISIPST